MLICFSDCTRQLCSVVRTAWVFALDNFDAQLSQGVWIKLTEEPKGIALWGRALWRDIKLPGRLGLLIQPDIDASYELIKLIPA